MRFFTTLVLFLASLLKIEAMSAEDQDLVAVSIYKKAYEIGLVSKKAMHHVLSMPRWNTSATSAFNKNSFDIMCRDNQVQINLNRLFLNAIINSWLERESQGRFYNQYTAFLMENRISEYDINALHEILNPIARANIKFRDVMSYITKSGSIQVFHEIIGEDLKLQGLEKTFYSISSKNFGRIYWISRLYSEKEATVNEYQWRMKYMFGKKEEEKIVEEKWLLNLYGDAVKRGVIPLEEWKQVIEHKEKIEINPMRIIMSAMIQMIIFGSDLYEFLRTYGIHPLNIFRMEPIVRSFCNSKTKVVGTSNDKMRLSEIIIPNVNSLRYVWEIISADLAKIGVKEGSYFVPREDLGLNL